ncbi:MAG: phosphomannomutase/phosphoglucomutase, partial [Pyrobaculum sp.]
MPLYLEKVAEERGVRIVRQRVGHSFQKPTAVRHNALFWAEYSGHVGFRDHNYFDDGIYAALKLLSTLGEAGVSLDKVLDTAPKIYEERLDIKAADPRKVVGDVKRRVANMEYYEIDGLDIRTKEGRLLIRPSNTEPVVRVKVESETKEGLEKLKSLLSQLTSP